MELDTRINRRLNGAIKRHIRIHIEIAINAKPSSFMAGYRVRHFVRGKPIDAAVHPTVLDRDVIGTFDLIEVGSPFKESRFFN
jgi:hypothetical protein